MDDDYHVVLWDEWNKPGVSDLPNTITMSDYQMLTGTKLGYFTLGQNGILKEMVIRRHE